MTQTTKSPSEAKPNGDLIIPYVILVQSNSDFAKEQKAKIGEIRNTATLALYGNETEAAEFVVLSQSESWRYDVKAPGQTQFKYAFKTTRNASNNNLPWSYKGNQDGTENPNGLWDWERTQQIECVVIMIKDLLAFKAERERLAKEGGLPDPNKSLMPAVLTFRNTSFQAGKQVSTAQARLNSFGVKVPFWNYILKMRTIKKSKEEQSWHIYEVNTQQFSALPEEFKQDVARWAEQVSASNIVTEEQIEAEREAAAPTPPPAAGYQPGVRNYAPQS